MAEIYFTSRDRKEKYRLPVLPKEFPKLERSSSSEEFETFNNGFYNYIGNMGLYNFTLEGFLPAVDKSYPFIKEKINPYQIINFWARSLSKKQPIRIIMLRKTGLNLPVEAVNMLVSIESMSHNENKMHDVVYSVNFKEWRE